MGGGGVDFQDDFGLKVDRWLVLTLPVQSNFPPSWLSMASIGDVLTLRACSTARPSLHARLTECRMAISSTCSLVNGLSTKAAAHLKQTHQSLSFTACLFICYMKMTSMVKSNPNSNQNQFNRLITIMGFSYVCRYMVWCLHSIT